MFCGAVSYAPEETASSRMSSLLTLMFSASNANEPVSPGMTEGSAKYAESRMRNRGEQSVSGQDRNHRPEARHEHRNHPSQRPTG